MTTTDYARFLTACVCADPNIEEGLADDELYGVYISWCILQCERPEPSRHSGRPCGVLVSASIGVHRAASSGPGCG